MTHAASPAPDVTVGDRLRGALVTARIRQVEAARKLGISQPALSRRLSGNAPWRDGEVEKLAAICGIPLSDLMAVA